MEEVEAVSTEEVVEAAPEQSESEVVEQKEDTHVPLSALQKERKKRKETEQRAQWLEQQVLMLAQNKSQVPEKEEDNSNWESVTKGDLKEYSAQERQQIIRTIREEDWLKSNQDKIEIINEKLPELLEKKKHIAHAIANSPNRYEEAWDQLMGHGKVQKPAKTEKKPVNAPLSPANIPKSAGVNQALNIMDMTDREFNDWRMKARRRR